MNIAIIGCGNIAQTHAAELHGLGHQIVAAINATPQKAERFAAQWGASYAGSDIARALADDIDVVHICTPPTLHDEMVRTVIEAGKHVICEKPLCLDPVQARDLWQRVQAKGVVAAVNFNVRYHEACQRARAAIHAKDFGRICLIHGGYLQEFHVLPAQYMWRYIPELAGPVRATTEIGSHWIDLCRYWTGLEIEAVSANYGKFSPVRYRKDGMMYAEPQAGADEMEVDTDDAAVVSLRFSNGAIGDLLLSEVSHGRSNSVRMEVTGTKKSVWWDSEQPYQLHTAAKFSGVTTVTNAFGGGFPNTFGAFFREVYAEIEAGHPSQTPAYPTFYDGYRNAAVCRAIYESAAHNSQWTEVLK